MIFGLDLPPGIPLVFVYLNRDGRVSRGQEGSWSGFVSGFEAWVWFFGQIWLKFVFWFLGLWALIRGYISSECCIVHMIDRLSGKRTD